MGCIKGKLRAKLEKGNFRCRKCGGCSRFKKDICKAEYIDYTIPEKEESIPVPDGEKKDKKVKKDKKEKGDKKKRKNKKKRDK